MKNKGRAVMASTMLLLLGIAPGLWAQSASGGERAELQLQVRELEGQLASSGGADASARARLEHLRTRLTHGDFKPGDAIVLFVRGEETLSDTFRVEPPRELRLPGLDPIDLTGVLHDELPAHLDRELRRYLRQPELTAFPLVRVGVLGAVGKPGFYLFRPDTRFLDVFGAADGLAKNAKVEEMELRRRGEPVAQAETLRRAMAEGWDLQQVAIRPGDEVYVPEKGPPISVRDWVFITSGLVGLTFTVLTAAGAF